MNDTTLKVMHYALYTAIASMIIAPMLIIGFDL